MDDVPALRAVHVVNTVDALYYSSGSVLVVIVYVTQG